MIPKLYKDTGSLLAALATQGVTPSKEFEWWFRFAAADSRASYRFTKAISGRYAYQVSEGSARILDDGSSRPSVIVSIVLGALSPARAERVCAETLPVAQLHGLEFLGIGCQCPRVPWEVFKWLPLDGAIWQLRHFADTGQDGPIDYVFAFAGGDSALLERTLSGLGMRTHVIDSADSPRVDSNSGSSGLLLARVRGDSTDVDLRNRFNQASQAATGAGGALQGVTFGEHDGKW